jgi:uncharacterized membrane protein
MEGIMSDLIVVGFHGKHRAAEVLDQLQQLNADWVINLEDGVAAYRRDNGKLRVEQSLNLTGKQGGTLGATLGLLVGGLLAAPFTAGASAGAAAAAIGSSAVAMGSIGGIAGDDDATNWKERFGISDEFVRNLGGMLQPGDSAIFALLSTSDRDAAAQHFSRYGGKVLYTNLSPAGEARLQETIRA